MRIRGQGSISWVLFTCLASLNLIACALTTFAVAQAGEGYIEVGFSQSNKSNVAIVPFDFEGKHAQLADDISFLISSSILLSYERYGGSLNYKQKPGQMISREKEIKYFDLIENLARDQDYAMAIWGKVLEFEDGLAIDSYMQFPGEQEEGQHKTRIDIRGLGEPLWVSLRPDRLSFPQLAIDSEQAQEISAAAGSIRNLRESPSADSKIVGSIAGKKRYSVLEYSKPWVRVRTETGEVGWTSVEAFCNFEKCKDLLEVVSFSSQILKLKRDNAPEIEGKIQKSERDFADQLVAIQYLRRGAYLDATRTAALHLVGGDPPISETEDVEKRILNSDVSLGSPSEANFVNIFIVSRLAYDGINAPLDHSRLARATKALLNASLFDPQNRAILANLKVLTPKVVRPEDADKALAMLESSLSAAHIAFPECEEEPGVDIGPVASVAFTPDGTRIVTGSINGTTLLWDAMSAHELGGLKGLGATITSAGIVADRALSWDAMSGHELVGLKGLDATITSAAFSPDGKRIVTALNDNTARVWDARTGAELAIFGDKTEPITSVAFSPDGTRILTGRSDGTILLWDVQTKQKLSVLKGPGTEVSSVAFSPDGKRIVTGSINGTTLLWDAGTGRKLSAFTRPGTKVSSVAFSPDGALILTGSDYTALLWDTITGQKLGKLKGHTGSVSSVAFSPDGKRIVTGSQDDNIARLWDSQTRQELASLEGHTGAVSSVAFSPDGARILTGSYDKTVRLWDGKTGQQSYLQGSRCDRTLSLQHSRRQLQKGRARRAGP